MGFNYLQTDDRDYYFAQFDKKSKRRPLSFNLIGPNGEEVFLEVHSTSVLRSYCKKKYLPFGQSGRKIWRSILESKGYKVISNYES
jgi:hypothetical protein